MNKTARVSVLIVVCALVAPALVGCAPESEPSAVVPATEAVEEQTSQQQASVDEALNSAQAAVNELVSVGDGLESRIKGLQIKSDLQEIQRKLTDAIGEAGDKKVAALDELSTAFDSLIYRLDMAAGKLPEGGTVRTELEGFSQQLKDTQASLAAAAASYEASSTPSP
jgi:hypothetical protein